MEQEFYDRILNGLKAIYVSRHSPHHGTPIKWELHPDQIYATVTEQYGLSEQKVDFSFRDSASWSWREYTHADSLKIFGERYTLDGERIGR